MWVVKGQTAEGRIVEYKVPAGKDTERAFVMALAFQEHGKTSPSDPLTAETDVLWTSDNVMNLPTPLTIKSRANFGIERRVSKGVWERHSQRAFRTRESATEALETAASEYPNDKFRIVASETSATVIAVSKNTMDAEVNEEVPDESGEQLTVEGSEAEPETPQAEQEAPVAPPAPSKSSKSKAA
jgi:hypothetical protein